MSKNHDLFDFCNDSTSNNNLNDLYLFKRVQPENASRIKNIYQNWSNMDYLTYWVKNYCLNVYQSWSMSK